MELEVVVMQHFPSFHDIFVLLLDESVHSGTLQIVSENVELILWFYSIVKILSDVYVFLRGCLLATLVCCNLDLISSQNFAKSSWIVMEE